MSELEARVRNLELNLLDDLHLASRFKEVPILVLEHARVTGETEGTRVNLFDLITSTAEGDLHYVQYTSQENVRLRKDMSHTDLTFNIASFDFDAPGHRGVTDEEFWYWAWQAWLLTPQPNIIHRTRGGARAIYCIEPMNDPDSFEVGRLKLFHKLVTQLTESTNNVLVGDEIKDWTRLLRCPLVLRPNADGTVTDLRDMPVIAWHTRKVSLDGRLPPRKPRVVPNGDAHYTGQDGIIDRFLRTQHYPGARNSSLFSVCCWIYKRYTQEDTERLIDKVREHAHTEGLTETETEAVARSARTTAERERTTTRSEE